MGQNRNKLINILIGNLSNAIVHRILEKSINQPELSEKYRKELINSFQIAKRYRENINPQNIPLPETDRDYIKEKLTRKIKSELQARIAKGYENINLSVIEEEIDKALAELTII